MLVYAVQNALLKYIRNSGAVAKHGEMSQLVQVMFLGDINELARAHLLSPSTIVTAQKNMDHEAYSWPMNSSGDDL